MRAGGTFEAGGDASRNEADYVPRMNVFRDRVIPEGHKEREKI